MKFNIKYNPQVNMELITIISDFLNPEPIKLLMTQTDYISLKKAIDNAINRCKEGKLDIQELEKMLERIKIQLENSRVVDSNVPQLKLTNKGRSLHFGSKKLKNKGRGAYPKKPVGAPKIKMCNRK